MPFPRFFHRFAKDENKKPKSHNTPVKTDVSKQENERNEEDRDLLESSHAYQETGYTIG